MATRSRHVCVFLGAGAGRACGLPVVSQLTEQVLSSLTGDKKATFEHQLKGRNLEQALSRLRRIAALLTGNQVLDQLTAESAKKLDESVCTAIVNNLDISGADLVPMKHFIAWAGRANYRVPVELFTVNYDLLIETALDFLRVPYFDGFVGTLKARFHTELVEALPSANDQSVPAFFVRLWKLHGSVNWTWDHREVLRLGAPIPGGQVAAIYPSDAKYEESRRVPFVVLQDRFRRSLQHPETLTILAGYSFSDDHLNELIFDAASRRERSDFIAFCHSKIPDEVSALATITPNLQVISGREAIIGGLRATWKDPGGAVPSVWEDNQMALRDFRSLASYLARSVAEEPDSGKNLRELTGEASFARGAAAAPEGDG